MLAWRKTWARAHSTAATLLTTSDFVEFAVRCRVSEPLAFTLPLPGKPGLTKLNLETAPASAYERDSVGHFISTLKTVDPTLTSVSLTTLDGVTVAKTASLKALAPVPMLLRLNTATLALEKEGLVDDIEQMAGETESAAFGTVKRYIERDSRTAIPIDQFYTRCKNVGADDSTSKKWLAEFQRRNLVLHYDQSKDDALRSTVILRPNKGESFAAFQAALDPVLYNLKHERMATESQILDAQEEWRKVATIETELRNAATTAPNVQKFLGLGFITTFYGGLAYTVWDVYSWDVMEPITYFIGFSAVLASSFYHTMTNRESTYPNMWNRAYEKKLSALAKDKKFDLHKSHALLAQINGLKKDVQVLRLLEGKTATPAKAAKPATTAAA
ncbi:hypothetical protein SPRG_11578 [Saprolegnia parasitica CBS 223.65]|uniref:Calcium uniporter protein C-terminal domain-containing protein n=1 Tax=Saprolegnia parasitica (strain CBS 223.65) TaxID=695850 RepID=A0A067BWC6_SAPPC|nr:hypothetical protein SPRG_11578 [Saprolegnia parasitica CBS 223.65]KDO22819.1 hypothetical protein SPRG_11578 [Saprolegnia parasitica CBS 223.65]|eukprot:XP_012206490.1 hypothetical protein SPRG_11578 [Saprolegnia parasitica CBS 223.65]